MNFYAILNCTIVLLGVAPAVYAIKELPPKVIAATPYCENTNIIDQAPLITLDQVKPGQIDRIVVSKQRKKLYILSKGFVVKEYRVAFGFGFLNGPKSQMGDGRTPEGLYKIEMKNPKSNYRKGLKISYPNSYDRQFAKQYRVSPGGDILIHGFPVRPVDGLIPDEVKQNHPDQNWTQGCIGLTDSEIDEIYALVSVGVLVEICPL